MNHKSKPGSSPDLRALHQAQREYFRSGATRSQQFRNLQLKRLRQAIVDREAELCTALEADLGKSAFDAWSNEIGLVLSECRHSIRHLGRWMRRRRFGLEPHLWPARGEILAEPWGSVLIMAPWNYPVQLLLLPLVGAIAAGNTAVLKPSELAPHVSAVCRHLVAATFPEEYIALVEGEADLARELVAMDFDYIFFTGSVPVGKSIMRAASENLTPLTLELGGKSPAFVLADADLPYTARKIALGKFNNAGQTCVAPDYVLVDRRVADSFLAELKIATEGFYPGPASSQAGNTPAGPVPASGSSMATTATGNPANLAPGKIISPRHFQRLADMADRSGAPVIHGGNRDMARLWMQPTIFYPASWEDSLMEDEIFGPLLPVIPYDSLDLAMNQVLARPKPLSCYVFSRSRKAADQVVRTLPFGGGCVNETLVHVASHHLPFGGAGPSGLGRYHGKASFDSFSHHKSLLHHGGRPEMTLAYPGQQISLGLLRRILG